MGGATHRDPWDKQGGAFFRGANGLTMHTNPLSKGGTHWVGAIKTHCTATDSVAANRRLNSRRSGNSSKIQVKSEGALVEGAFWGLPREGVQFLPRRASKIYPPPTRHALWLQAAFPFTGIGNGVVCTKKCPSLC